MNKLEVDSRINGKEGEQDSPEALDLADIVLEGNKIVMTPNFKFGEMPSYDQVPAGTRMRPDHINVSGL